MAKKKIKLFYIGDKFYPESGSMMSSIYTEKYERFDWGFVNVELAKGNEIVIRQATKKELEWATKRLAEIKVMR